MIHPPRKRKQDKPGFSLLEACVVMACLAIIATFMGKIFMNAIMLSEMSRSQLTQQQIANQLIRNLKTDLQEATFVNPGQLKGDALGARLRIKNALGEDILYQYDSKNNKITRTIGSKVVNSFPMSESQYDNYQVICDVPCFQYDSPANDSTATGLVTINLNSIQDTRSGWLADRTNNSAKNTTNQQVWNRFYFKAAPQFRVNVNTQYN